MVELDQVDLQILHYLRENSQITLKELEDKIGKKISTIHNRIKKLEDGGIIEKYSAVINLADIGYPLVSFIMLSFDAQNTTQDQDEVAERLSKIPRVEEVHLIAGEYDILLKVRSKNIDDLGLFVTKDLKDISGIGRSRTFVSLKIVKEKNNEPFLISEIADIED